MSLEKTGIEQRIVAFTQLGKTLSYFTTDREWPGYECGVSEEEFNHFNAVIKTSKAGNGWFTEDNVRMALAGMAHMLERDKLDHWLSEYQIQDKNQTVGLIMAGNIPMVGFHDLLCVMLTGHSATVKLSSDDNRLMPEMCKLLFAMHPELETSVKWVEDRLTAYDAVIATGSNNSARYFEKYFEDVPNIIRKNRTSVAVLSGDESGDELKALGQDIFSYFGLGCRNVSKVLIPETFELDKIFKAIYDHNQIINHQKYANNYDYNKAVYLMNQEDFLENGFVMFKQDHGLHSPLAVIYYQHYKSSDDVNEFLAQYQDEIQCVVSKEKVPFGQAQYPELWDYADGVDTMAFLTGL